MEMNERNKLEMQQIPIVSVSTIIDHSAIEIKKPKKLYFSDGIIEEYSEDEMEDEPDCKEIIESELEWGPWLIHKSVKAGSNVLAACDFAGEKLASFLGITTPKYAAEIDDYRKRQEDEKARLEKELYEYASWQETKKLTDDLPIVKEVKSLEKF